MSGPLLSRRVVVRSTGLATMAAAALTGCDLDLDSSAPPSPTPSPDADERLLLAARAELAVLIGRISASTGPAALADLEQVHRTQLSALDGEPRPRRRRTRPWTGTQLVARERVAAARFTAWAGQAHSGDLARVLASIAAGIRMQPLLQDAS
jgi:hypothetical protein